MQVEQPDGDLHDIPPVDRPTTVPDYQTNNLHHTPIPHPKPPKHYAHPFCTAYVLKSPCPINTQPPPLKRGGHSNSIVPRPKDVQATGKSYLHSQLQLHAVPLVESAQDNSLASGSWSPSRTADVAAAEYAAVRCQRSWRSTKHRHCAEQREECGQEVCQQQQERQEPPQYFHHHDGHHERPRQQKRGGHAGTAQGCSSSSDVVNDKAGAGACMGRAYRTDLHAESMRMHS